MFAWIAKAYSWASGKIDSTIAGWVHDVVNGLYAFLHAIFTDVGEAWKVLVSTADGVWRILDQFASFVATAFEHLYKVWIPDIISWITHDILDPLLKAVAWIANEGATMWHYISHPADLVDLIWDDVIAKLETDTVNTAEKLGGWFMTLLLKNTDKFVEMMEDIIDAII